MLVLIDESGDPGFKLVRGSSPHFVMAMVIFDDEADAERASVAIRELRAQLRLKTEFKFAKSHARVKDAFFDCVCAYRFRVRALVVDKSRVYSEIYVREKNCSTTTSSNCCWSTTTAD